MEEKNYKNSVDLKSEQVFKREYYDRQRNFDLGMKREKNLKNTLLNNGEEIRWEIKTDAQGNKTLYFYLETHQIGCGKKPIWELSGINVPTWTHFLASLPHPDDVEQFGRFQLHTTWTRDELFALIEKYLNENPDVEGKNRKIGLPYELDNSDDRNYHTYVKERCSSGGYRYSRGILIPIYILFDRFYLTNFDVEDFKPKNTLEDVMDWYEKENPKEENK